MTATATAALGPAPSVTVARALGSSTRSDIFSHLLTTGSVLSAREVAARFDLHPNVARAHLQTLADAGLVAVGRRKHPGGGRPARTFRARRDTAEQVAAAATTEPAASPATGVVLGLLADLAERPGPGTLADRLRQAAAAAGRRAVSGLVGGGSSRTLAELAASVVAGLRPVAPGAVVAGASADGQAWVDVGGVRGLCPALAIQREDLARAFEEGLVTGAFAAAGVAVTLAEPAGTPHADGWRVRSAGRGAVRSAVPAAALDTRSLPREAGVVQAMRAITTLGRGDVLEILAEGPGSPASFARWADRAGHVLLGVERAEVPPGRPAIRLLIRKGR